MDRHRGAVPTESLDMPTYLVTGGAGFIGSHIATALVRRGDKVRVLDNFSTGRLDNLVAVADEIDLITGDVCDEASVARAVVGCDAVFHQAALASVPRSVADPLATTERPSEDELYILREEVDPHRYILGRAG